jgi:sporulation protein YabP
MQEGIKSCVNCSIEAWKALSLCGVMNISSFDEENISLDTESGKVFIEGNDLKIISLNENGEIFVDGNISGVFVSENKPIKKGILSRLFGK